MTQAVTQRGEIAALPRPASRRRKPGLHLIRRGSIYYFRRRSPTALLRIGAPPFTCFSLRTHFQREAMKRAAALLIALEEAERMIVTERQTGALSAQEIKAILDEVVRSELGRIIDGLDVQQPRSTDIVEARIASLEAEIAALRDSARLRDFSRIESRVAEAAERLAIALETPLQGALGRQAVAKIRAVKQAELQIEDGEDIAEAAADLIEDHLSGDLGKVREAPLTLSRAIDCALEHATSDDMRNKYRATGLIALEHLGDVSLHSIDKVKVETLMRFIFRLPKNHGKAHGKNRYATAGCALSKAEEVRRADEADDAQIAAMRARSDISDLEKRSQLKALLVPRQTPANTQHHLNRFRGIFKAAAKHLGYTGECRFMSDAELNRLIDRAKPRDDIAFHNNLPKTRECWSKERVMQLLLSPLYTGCFSRHRRWRPGAVIVRDAQYWVPLILMTIGSRVDELLRLDKSAVILRDGVFCLALNVSFTDDGKTPSATRYIPVPDLLMRLGFIDWVRGLPGGPLAPLFPEIAENAEICELSNIFSKRCATLFKKLGIKDWNQDLYALRKTLSTSLSIAGTEDSKRQAIAGHRGGSILNVHYTSHDVRGLKEIIDQVDFKVEIEHSDRHGFPMIVGCNLLSEQPVEIDLCLADDGSAASFAVASNSPAEPGLHVRIAESMPEGRSDQNDIVVLPEITAARRLHNRLRGREMRKLNDPAKQRALEYLLMLGHPAASESHAILAK